MGLEVLHALFIRIAYLFIVIAYFSFRLYSRLHRVCILIDIKSRNLDFYTNFKHTCLLAQSCPICGLKRLAWQQDLLELLRGFHR